MATASHHRRKKAELGTSDAFFIRVHEIVMCVHVEKEKEIVAANQFNE
jgi:hypothetical protein